MILKISSKLRNYQYVSIGFFNPTTVNEISSIMTRLPSKLQYLPIFFIVRRYRKTTYFQLYYTDCYDHVRVFHAFPNAKFVGEKVKLIIT